MESEEERLSLLACPNDDRLTDARRCSYHKSLKTLAHTEPSSAACLANRQGGEIFRCQIFYFCFWKMKNLRRTDDGSGGVRNRHHDGGVGSTTSNKTNNGSSREVANNYRQQQRERERESKIGAKSVPKSLPPLCDIY